MEHKLDHEGAPRFAYCFGGALQSQTMKSTNANIQRI